MATLHYAPLLALLVLLPVCSADFNLSIPILAPFFGGNICQADLCGRGNCRITNNTIAGFECECDSGWRQARPENDTSLKFLPCVVPNCTLNYNCANAAPPAPYTRTSNISFGDPCSWANCGGGTCNSTSLFTHTCECRRGYYNLFNASAFPCYNECAIGGDCQNVGLGLWNSSSGPLHRNPDDLNSSTSHTECAWTIWLIIMVTTLAQLVLSKDT